ncbi:MAG: hypothetical protein J6Y47_03270 [Bacteroidales bacterium]|nr:hypothetical protein [Bacteroidales bacterium]
MKNNSYKIDNYTELKRINKQTARKIYNMNLPVYFIPCKELPLSPWLDFGTWTTKEKTESEFDMFCNSFEYYNCNNETGKYIAFYIPVCYVDKFTGERKWNGYLAEHYNHVEQYDYNYTPKTEKQILHDIRNDYLQKICSPAPYGKTNCNY